MKKILALVLVACFSLSGVNKASAQRNMGYHAHSYDGGFRVTKKNYINTSRRASHRSFNRAVQGFAQPGRSCSRKTSCASKRSCTSNKRSCSKYMRMSSCKSKSSCSKKRSSCGRGNGTMRNYRSWDFSDHSDLRDVPNLRGRNMNCRGKSSCSKTKSSCSKQKASCSRGQKKACCKSKSSCKKKACTKKQTRSSSRYNRY